MSAWMVLPLLMGAALVLYAVMRWLDDLGSL